MAKKPSICFCGLPKEINQEYHVAALAGTLNRSGNETSQHVDPMSLTSSSSMNRCVANQYINTPQWVFSSSTLSHRSPEVKSSSRTEHVSENVANAHAMPSSLVPIFKIPDAWRLCVLLPHSILPSVLVLRKNQRTASCLPNHRTVTGMFCPVGISQMRGPSIRDSSTPRRLQRPRDTKASSYQPMTPKLCHWVLYVFPGF